MTTPDNRRSFYLFESRSATIEGFRYHCLDEGSGPVLLLVHGNPTLSFYWQDPVRPLRARYRVVVADHVGCGLSDKPDAHAVPLPAGHARSRTSAMLRSSRTPTSRSCLC
jgi:haloalkane dehalogenase